MKLFPGEELSETAAHVLYLSAAMWLREGDRERRREEDKSVRSEAIAADGQARSWEH
jgi:hypothetical protein